MSNRYHTSNVIDLSSALEQQSLADEARIDNREDYLSYDIGNIQALDYNEELEQIEYFGLSEDDDSIDEHQFSPSPKPNLDINEVIKASPQLVEILALYFNEAQQLLNIEGFLFVNQEYKLRQKLGNTQTAYNCGFCLLSDYEDNLGELILFRKKRFTEQELDQIDLLIHLMTTPLTKAMRRQRLAVS